MFRNITKDPEFWYIFFFNGLIIGYYYMGQIDPIYVIFIYYFQSLIIGFFNFIRMYKLTNFSTEGFTSNGNPVQSNSTNAKKNALFFLLHYNLFHLVYFFFLSFMAIRLSGTGIGFDSHFFLFTIFTYIINTAFALKFHLENDKVEKPNIGTIMFMPYLRVVPMHIFVLLGVGLIMKEKTLAGIDYLEFFVILKTISDLLMHIISEKTWLPHKRSLPWEVVE